MKVIIIGGGIVGLATAHQLIERYPKHEVLVLEKEKQIPTKLSGGERQRVAIARSLINSPRVLLADEPTGNLDERTGGQVMDLLLATCEEEKTGLILVTHNPSFAEAADSRVFLKEGKLSAGREPETKETTAND